MFEKSKIPLNFKCHLNKIIVILQCKLDEQGGRFPIKIMSASYKGKT